MAADLTASDFQLMMPVGEGQFGVVHVAKRVSDGALVAIKQIPLHGITSDALLKSILDEVSIMKELNHPFVVKFYGSYKTSIHLCIVLSFLPGGELFFHLEKTGVFPEAFARFYTAEIACALSYLHSRNIIYRDLKPENVVLDAQGHATLLDFGLAKANVTSADTLVGTAEYIAPEFLRGERHTTAVDWWSLGVMLYEMLTGELPFTADAKDKLWELILVKPLNFDHELLSDSAKDLLRRLLDRNGDSRLQSFKELSQHPFFAGLDWEALLLKKLPAPIAPNADHKKNFHPVDG